MSDAIVNGNIDAIADDIPPTRAAVFLACRDSFFHADVIAAQNVESWDAILRRTNDLLNRLYYSDSDHHMERGFSNFGTLHQYLYNETEIFLHGEQPESISTADNDQSPPTFRKTGEFWKDIDVQNLLQRTRWVAVDSILETRDRYGMLDVYPDKLVDLVPWSMALYPGCFADWRILGLKTALMDMLRERVFTIPTGVDWAWPEREPASVSLINLSDYGMWNYSGIVIDSSVLKEVSRLGKIPLIPLKDPLHPRDKESWALWTNHIVVIGMADNEMGTEVGRLTWMLSHLKYPLAWKAEEFRISVEGRTKKRKETFLRTAGLVNINDMATRIVFVLPTKGMRCIQIAGHEFRVSTTNCEGELDDNIPIREVDMTDMISDALQIVLSSQENLRVAFSNYAGRYFKDELNWVEVDNLVTLLTVRWHQRVETKLETTWDERKAWGAPRDVLKSLGLDPDISITDDSYHDYGGENAVTCLDQRVTCREMSDHYPALSFGVWNSFCELALITGRARYVVINVEDKADKVAVDKRILNGAHDRIARGQFMRKAFEQWKVSACIMDDVAFPNENKVSSSYWCAIINKFSYYGNSNWGKTAFWFAAYFLVSQVKCGWSMNINLNCSGVTLTGIRTPSSTWRNNCNTEWGGFTLYGNKEYYRDNTMGSNELSDGKWIQVGEGIEDPHLFSALMRLNLEEKDWQLSYKSYACSDKLGGNVSWLVDALNPSILAKDLGWTGAYMSGRRGLKWGWGIRVRMRDFSINKVKTLVIPTASATIMMGSDYFSKTLLVRSVKLPSDLAVGRSLGAASSHFSSLNRTADSENKNTDPDASAEALALRIQNLELKLERLKLAP